MHDLARLVNGDDDITRRVQNDLKDPFTFSNELISRLQHREFTPEAAVLVRKCLGVTGLRTGLSFSNHIDRFQTEVAQRGLNP